MLQKKNFDVIICVHNSPRYLRWCLSSIFNSESLNIFNVIIVDDFSDDVTKQVIKEFESKYHENVHVITNKTNLGYVKSANKGIRESVSENIVMLNSDVIVTDNWLEKFHEALKKDPKIGLISPLTNNGANLTVKLPPGFDYIHMNDFLEKNSKKLYPDAMTVVGHCLLITRNVIEKIGLFDEIYSPAYTEETDYHFKAINNGFRAVIADDTYVFHKGEGSFENRSQLFEDHLKIFLSRWGKQFRKLLAEYDKKNALGYLRDQRTQMPFFEKYSYRPSYDVVFLLPGLTAGIGGITTVVEIVNELIRSGLRANIAYLMKKRIDLDMLFEPLQYDELKQFLAFPPNTKVLVATEYGTVDAVSQIAKSHHIVSAYFIQDYEGWFEPIRLLNFVKKTYQKIDNKIVVSHWLHNMLKEHDDCDSTIINVCVSPEDFYKIDQLPTELNELKKNCKIIVFSMMSEYERRGSIYFVQAMRELLKSTTDIGFVVTQRSTNNLIDFEDNRLLNVGMLNREMIPKYFSGCDVIVDASLFHGFGLPGLEGMTCSMAGILSDVNLDYAKDGYNCILVEPKNVNQIKEAIIKLRDNPELLKKLKTNARKTALEFSWDKLSSQYIDYFKNLTASYEENKKRPDFGYQELMTYKNIPEIIKTKEIAQRPGKIDKLTPSGKDLLKGFVYYSKEQGFLVAIKESLKWLFK